MDQPYPQTAHGRLVAAYLADLDRQDVRYALLRNAGGLPDRPEGDIDVVTDRTDRAGQVLHAAAAREGYVPVRAARHTWHRIHALAPGSGVTGGAPLVIDLQPGVTHRRGISIPAARVLAGRERRGGFWVAGSGVEGAALVLHCAIERGADPARYSGRLRRLVADHRAAVVSELSAVVGSSLAAQAVDDLEAAIPQLRSAFRGQPARALAQRLPSLARYARQPARIRAAPGVAAEMERRGVRLAGGRLDALRRSAAIVSEDGDATLDEALEICRRAYASCPG